MTDRAFFGGLYIMKNLDIKFIGLPGSPMGDSGADFGKSFLAGGGQLRKEMGVPIKKLLEGAFVLLTFVLLN
ncbi:hypothetical protein C6A37_07545 [Desulfobacteraceae bacterium SEEP-SAG9]|nr:hypothetical protein C6A37_07545 [Desulfobacteraceae bacterium SEEP-SAG9]